MTEITRSEKDQESQVEKSQEVPVKTTQEIQKAAPWNVLSSVEEMELFFDRMERLLESLMPRSWLRPRREWPSWRELTAPLEGWLPRIDVIDRDQEIVVRAELSGVAKEDLDVSITNNRLTIKGSVRREEKEEKGAYYRAELSRGAFTRALTLPAEVEGDKAKATFKDGILELTLPKVEAAQKYAIKVE
jgi:HSP20 family protein